MNLSGESVKGLAIKYDVPLERLIVVSDDVGAARRRRSASAGPARRAARRGSSPSSTASARTSSRACASASRGENFQPGEPIDDYVLSRFSKKERPVVDEAIATGVRGARAVFVTEGIDAAMNRFNRSPEEDPAN